MKEIIKVLINLKHIRTQINENIEEIEKLIINSKNKKL